MQKFRTYYGEKLSLLNTQGRERWEINRKGTMPNLPKHICKHPGCYVYTSNTYCDTHTIQHNKDKDKYRPSSRQRGYTRRWEKVSKLFLKEHPLCECDECTKVHKLTTANVVHHVIPHHGNYELFWDEDNWQAMNKRCHDRHTLNEIRKAKTRK